MIGGTIFGKNGVRRNLLHNFTNSRESHPFWFGINIASYTFWIIIFCYKWRLNEIKGSYMSKVLTFIFFSVIFVGNASAVTYDISGLFTFYGPDNSTKQSA